MNGINECVTETSEEIAIAGVENGGTGKHVAKAKPRSKTTFTLTPVSFPYHERRWIDVDPRKFSQSCFEVSKFMIRLLRHDDAVHREDDGAVRFDDLAEKFKAKFDGTSQWSIEAWITLLARGGRPKQRFQCCLNTYSSKLFLYFRATQGHSGGTLVDPTLQDNVLLPDDFAKNICHIGNAHDMHSIIQGGLIPGGKSLKRDSVFHSREPDVRQSNSGRSSIRSGQTQNRGVQKYVETLPKYSVLVQSEARSKKRIALLSTSIACNRSFQQTTCDLH